MKDNDHWSECWVGSEPHKGSSIINTKTREVIAYFGGDESTHAIVTVVVAAHNAALAATAAPVMQPEMKKIGWMWKKWGWTVTAHSKHREIHRVMDFSQPPESTKLSPDFISLEPIYIAATNRSQP